MSLAGHSILRPGEPFPSRTPNDVEQLRRATEYSARLRQVFRTSSIKNSDSISLVTDEIDALYFEKQASRILTIFRDRDQKSYEAWLVFFRSRGMLNNSVAVALARFNEDQSLTWLASHPPSNDSCNGPFDDSKWPKLDTDWSRTKLDKVGAKRKARNPYGYWL